MQFENELHVHELNFLVMTLCTHLEANIETRGTYSQ
jgi:hypothetical protein